MDEKPVVRCFVAFPLLSGDFTSPAVVSLELAAELRQKGYQVVGPDPHDMEELAAWERLHVQPRKKWFDRD